MLLKLLRQVAPPLAGALLVVAGAVVYLQPKQAGDPAPDISLAAAQFQFVMGSGRAADESLLIEKFENGVAVASVRGLSIQAGVHHWLTAEITSDVNRNAAAFFWRQKTRPTAVSRMELPGTGPQLVDLASAENWQGEIIEIGFLFEDADERGGTLAEVSLLSDSLALSVSQVLDDWNQFEPWSQRSINILYGGARKQALALPLLVSLWMLISLLIYAAVNFRQKPHFFRYATVIFFIAWVILDIRWTRNQVRQSAETLDMHVFSSEKFATTADGFLQQDIARVKRDVLSQEAGKILLVADKSVSDFYLKKARYYLLPHAAAVWPESWGTINPENLDYVFLFQTFYDEQAARNPRMIPSYVWKQITVPAEWRMSFKLIDVGDFGLLFAIERPADNH